LERRHPAGKLAAGSRQDAGAPGDVPNQNRSSGSHAPAWEQVLTLQRHQAWPLERPRWRSHAGAWERAKAAAGKCRM